MVSITIESRRRGGGRNLINNNDHDGFVYVSDENVEHLRELVKALVTGGHLTYPQIANVAGVNKQGLQNFAYGKTKRPKDEFLGNLFNNVRRVKHFEFDDVNIDALADKIIRGAREEQPPAFMFMNTLLEISEDELVKCADLLAGDYACFRHGMNSEVYKTHLKIHEYDESHKIVKFNLTHYMSNGQPNIGVGYVLPDGNGAFLIGKILEPKGLLTLNIDDIRPADSKLQKKPGAKIPKPDEMNGVFMQSVKERSAFSSRVLIRRIPPLGDSDPKDIFGMKMYEDIVRDELGQDGALKISNKCGESGLLKVFKVR